MMFPKFLIALLCTAFSCNGTIAQPYLEVQVSSAQQEAAYIWRNLQDISFFDQNGYQVVFPDHPFVERLKKKASEGTLNESDYQKLKNVLSNEVYKVEDYKKGLAAVNQQKESLNEMIDELHHLELDWHFRSYSTYPVLLTLYGPGGSYDPEQGSILLFTTVEGSFKQYQNPANTLIHEIVHLGIENALVGKYQIPHAFKERIVDNFVLLNFSQNLPDYRKQDMGDNRADQIMESQQDLKSLDLQISRILNDGN